MSCCFGGEDLAGLRRIAGTGTARRRNEWGEDALDLVLLCRGQHPVKPAVNRLLKSEHVFLLVVRQFQAVLFGAGHDLAGLRRRKVARCRLGRRGHSRGLLLLIGREQLIQVGVDVFLDLVELLPLVGGDVRASPPRSTA